MSVRAETSQGKQKAGATSKSRVQSDALLIGLQSAINDASSRVAALWLSFLTFMAYLTMTVGAVTHESLLKQTPIRLPVFNVELPLVGFFWIAPLFFLLVHFYLFLQLAILVRKVASFDKELCTSIASEEKQEQYRKRLDSFLVVQFLYGSKDERTGMTGRLLRLIAAISLVVLPIMLLLQFQLTFLPYHDAWVTWVHRLAVLIDLRLAWVFWFSIRNGRGEIDFPELKLDWLRGLSGDTALQKLRDALAKFLTFLRKILRYRRAEFASAAAILFASFFVFAYRDEMIAKAIQIPILRISGDTLVWEMQPISDAVLHGPINMVQGRPSAWFSNVLVVPNKKLIEDSAAETDFPSLSLRGRNLSGAILIGSDLRNVDFTGANLNEAHLERALLTRAKFNCGSTYDLRSKMSGWPKDECTWLQLASLTEAQLQAAEFDRARMHGAILIGANLVGAQFTGTQLQGAMLINAQLQAASIENASLNRAFLNGANLIGAMIRNSELDGMLIGNTFFQLAYIQHDRSKVRLVNGYQGSSEPAESGAAGSGAEGGAGNDRDVGGIGSLLSQQFMYAEFKSFEGVIHAEHVRSRFDPSQMLKTRRNAIAQLAAVNKMQNTDFDDVYEQAREVGWESIDHERKSDQAKLKESPPNLKDYTIDFMCNVGSSPYITAALIHGEKIMWVLKKIYSSSSKDQAARSASDSMEVLTRLDSPDCAGAKKLTPTEKVAVGLMKQEVALMGKDSTQRRKAEGGDGVKTTIGVSREHPQGTAQAASVN